MCALMTSPSRNRVRKLPLSPSECAQPEVGQGDDAAPSSQIFTPREASSYIVSMTTELQKIARAADFRFLTYLLEMSFQEAFRLTAELDPERLRSEEQEPNTKTDQSTDG